MFDLNIYKILMLGLLALIIFGPDQLPRLAAQAGRALRDLRRLADNARSELADGLGPEFRDLNIADLNPKAFVRKHLLEDIDEPVLPDLGPDLAEPYHSGPYQPEPDQAGALLYGEIPPYDLEAT